MGTFLKRPAYAAAAIVAAAGMLSAGAAIKPASAAATSGVQPDGQTTCHNATACEIFKQNGIGAGVEGSTAYATGVSGIATAAGFGMYGESWTGDGIEAYSNSGIGLVASASGSKPGLYADGNAVAVEAHGFGSGASVYAHPDGSGPAGVFDASGDTYFGTITYSNGAPASYAYNYNGNGADMSGTYIGVIGRSSNFPFVATDPNANDEFWVTGTGDVYAYSYHTIAAMRNGGAATTFGSEAASPTMEDNGTAQLVNGSATVKLDATFAQTIDASKAYQVMLSPDGDTRGLFCASKSPNGFVVREVQGGHGSISFDYHIYAPVAGQSHARMLAFSRSMINAMGPKATVVTPARVKPTKAPARPTH